jgi:hypothetical protein
VRYKILHDHCEHILRFTNATAGLDEIQQPAQLGAMVWQRPSMYGKLVAVFPVMVLLGKGNLRF